jgi:hypothetical protein
VRSHVQDQKALDLLATDHTPECPYCHELNAAGATVCADCGGRLTPKTSTGSARTTLDGTSAGAPEEVNVTVIHGCTCGGAGTCTACTLASYEADPFLTGVERTLELLDRPANVVPLDTWSRRV